MHFPAIVLSLLVAIWPSRMDGLTQRFVMNWDNPNNDQEAEQPTVQMTIFVRNKAPYLPYFLGLVDRLNYPKQKITLYIRGDHCVDDSLDITKEWLDKVQDLYARVDAILDGTAIAYRKDRGPLHWHEERFRHLINMKEEALETARSSGIDYLFFIDVDNFVTYENVLLDLIRAGKTVVAPMLDHTDLYSNFWADKTEKFFYKTCPEYRDIKLRKTLGLFAVPMVHSTFLIDLRKRDSIFLSYLTNPAHKGPLDDIINFAFNAERYGVQLWVTNEEEYGRMTKPLDRDDHLNDDFDAFVNLMQEYLLSETPMPVSRFLSPQIPVKTKLGFDQIYFINLKRRLNRRQRLKFYLDTLGIEGQIMEAVDGKALTKEDLRKLGVKKFPKYADPLHGRELTMGEIGCFLSHYAIWQDIIAKGHQRVLIFEDDVRFESGFKAKLSESMKEVDAAGLTKSWDLIYLGRKALDRTVEERVEGTKRLIRPGYTYWMMGYALSFGGAKKLVAQQPLSRLMPTDEFVPIMFDQHPNSEWKNAFGPRNLQALAIDPVICEPAKFTNDLHYSSDTENSATLPKDFIPEGDVTEFQLIRKMDEIISMRDKIDEEDGKNDNDNDNNDGGDNNIDDDDHDTDGDDNDEDVDIKINNDEVNSMPALTTSHLRNDSSSSSSSSSPSSPSSSSSPPVSSLPFGECEGTCKEIFSEARFAEYKHKILDIFRQVEELKKKEKNINSSNNDNNNNNKRGEQGVGKMEGPVVQPVDHLLPAFIHVDTGVAMPPGTAIPPGNAMPPGSGPMHLRDEL